MSVISCDSRCPYKSNREARQPSEKWTPALILSPFYRQRDSVTRESPGKNMGAIFPHYSPFQFNDSLFSGRSK